MSQPNASEVPPVSHEGTTTPAAAVLETAVTTEIETPVAVVPGTAIPSPHDTPMATLRASEHQSPFPAEGAGADGGISNQVEREDEAQATTPDLDEVSAPTSQVTPLPDSHKRDREPANTETPPEEDVPVLSALRAEPCVDIPAEAVAVEQDTTDTCGDAAAAMAEADGANTLPTEQLSREGSDAGTPTPEPCQTKNSDVAETVVENTSDGVVPETV